ncbi:MAG: hypothetical protein ACLUDD_05015 [Lactobacillus kalixensis]|uniref:hypothetical protein n=1 Tax=Lactobacillus kalixensis TaxID=227944 RepID=UPI003995E14B
MDNVKLNKINATVGMFADFNTFAEVINWVFENHSFPEALDMLGFSDVEDMSEQLTDDHGGFDEGNAKEICMNCLDGVDADEDPKLEYSDFQVDQMLGK